MADQLNMNGLSLEESKHANGFAAPGNKPRPAYIPPHLRGAMAGPPGPQGPQGPPGPPPGMDGPAPTGPPPMVNGGGVNGSAWGPPPQR